MEQIKRKRARAIIFSDNKLITMYREREGRVFYTFPGGGMEENENEEECVVREVLEEFGLTVKPIKKVYVYENERSIEHFFVCEWISGAFGSGAGEEYQPNRNNGVYKQTMIDLSEIPNLPLMPPEVAKAFYEDFMINGQKVRDDVKIIKGTMN